MMKGSIVILSVLVLIVVSQSTQSDSDGSDGSTFRCQTSSDCNDWGNCVNSTCICTERRSGPDCSITFLIRYPDWAPFFWTYTAIGAALHFIIVTWCCISLARFFYSTKLSERSRKSMSTWALIMLGIGSFLRLLYLLFDPHNMRGISNKYGNAILYNLPILFWVNAALLLFLYWIELQSRSRLTDLPNVMRYRPLLIGFIVATTVVLFPLCIWNMTSSIASLAAYHVALIIMIVTIVALCLHSGRKLLASIKKVMDTTQSPQYIIFLRTVTHFIISLMIILIIIIVTLIVFIGLSGLDYWLDTAFQLLIRIEEFTYALTMVLFLDKRRPKSTMSSDGNSDQGSKKDSQQMQSIVVQVQSDTETDTESIHPQSECAIVSPVIVLSNDNNNTPT
eukprot:TRINITY_DN374_c0_g1_i1.p1 TRINITY_DN374_c0_g1~~TRINITY_DN374_c0_g1_i1.p1  ORF type:complete len:393 (-),score=62.81 TRINITY_DN374_c0_g1_i1:28-1206(-)